MQKTRTKKKTISKRGYFGIGIENPKTDTNVGTLWRSAYIMGAAFVFTIGKEYKHQGSDTAKSWRHLPLYFYPDFDTFHTSLPYDCHLVGVELHTKSVPLPSFDHPERCVYLLGAEARGISKKALKQCEHIIELPSNKKISLNVATAGSIVMYDREAKSNKKASA